MRLGRQPRTYNPSIPHMSALMAGRQLAPAPIECDYTKGMPDDLGFMLNDQLGDCTCAAYFHARQIWSYNATGTEITNSDSDVLGLYEKACAYDPSNPTTDQGGNEQDVLTYLLNTGAPDCSKILAFVEVDPRNMDDVKRAIYENGCAYIGINLPQSALSADNTVAWDVIPNDTIAGGHAVILVGYDLDGFDLISWGKRYRCTNAFMAQYCEESYAIADPLWIAKTGKTPLGMSITELENLMVALKDDAN
jgi:hypothetical protein